MSASTQNVKGGLKYASKCFLIMLTWVPVVITIQDRVCFYSHVSGISMKPTLNPDSNHGSDDIVLVWKFGIKSNMALKIGDVVLLHSPTNPNQPIVKRIKGIQGDEIITKNPYPRKICTIPQNHLWLEGDGNHSTDSNVFGPVSKGLVIGKVTRILYPFYRFGALPDGGREARVSKLRNLE